MAKVVVRPPSARRPNASREIPPTTSRAIGVFQLIRGATTVTGPPCASEDPRGAGPEVETSVLMPAPPWPVSWVSRCSSAYARPASAA